MVLIFINTTTKVLFLGGIPERKEKKSVFLLFWGSVAFFRPNRCLALTGVLVEIETSFRAHLKAETISNRLVTIRKKSVRHGPSYGHFSGFKNDQKVPTGQNCQNWVYGGFRWF